MDEVTPHEVSRTNGGATWSAGAAITTSGSPKASPFSAGLYLQATEKTPDKYLKYWQDARLYALEKNSFGIANNDAGPVWLGVRLDSARNRSAYDAVIYRKGGFVLHCCA